MVILVVPDNVLVPVTPSVPLNVPEVAFRTPNVLVPPTYKFLPIPTPPATVNAPVAVEVAEVLLVIARLSIVILVNVCVHTLVPVEELIKIDPSDPGNPRSGSVWLTSMY